MSGWHLLATCVRVYRDLSRILWLWCKRGTRLPAVARNRETEREGTRGRQVTKQEKERDSSREQWTGWQAATIASITHGRLTADTTAAIFFAVGFISEHWFHWFLFLFLVLLSLTSGLSISIDSTPPDRVTEWHCHRLTKVSFNSKGPFGHSNYECSEQHWNQFSRTSQTRSVQVCQSHSNPFQRGMFSPLSRTTFSVQRHLSRG